MLIVPVISDSPPLIKDGRFGDFLHAFLREEKEGNKKKKKAFRGTIKHGHVQDATVAWNWGARTELGYNRILDIWDVSVMHTRFHANFADSSKKAASSFASPWTLHLNLADLEMGRVFEPKKKMEIRPHLGFRGAWIYKKEQMQEEERITGNNCAGIGLRSGLDSRWHFNRYMSFFGDGALSLLAGYYNVDRMGQQSERSNIAAAEVSFGLQYEAPLARHKLFTFRCGYEMNYLFNQSRWLDRFQHSSDLLTQATPGLSLQGITAGVRFDF